MVPGNTDQNDWNQGDAQRKQQPGFVGAQCQHDEDEAGKYPERWDAAQTGHRQRGGWSVGDPNGGAAQDQQDQQNKRGEASVGLSGAYGQQGDTGLTQDQQGGAVRSDAACQQGGAGQQGDHGDADAERFDRGRPGDLAGEAQDQDDAYHGEFGHDRRDG